MSWESGLYPRQPCLLTRHTFLGPSAGQEQGWKVPLFSPFHGFRTTSRQHRSVPVVHRLHRLQGQQGGHQGSPIERQGQGVTFETPCGLGSSGPLFGVATKLIIRVWMLSQKTANRRSCSSVLGARVSSPAGPNPSNECSLPRHFRRAAPQRAAPLFGFHFHRCGKIS